MSQPIEKISSGLIDDAGKAIIDAGGITGALLVVSVIMNVVLVWAYVNANNKNVDKYVEVSKASDKMLTTFGKFEGSIASLTSEAKSHGMSISQLVSASDRVNNAMTSVQHTLNTLMLYQGVNRNNPPSSPPDTNSPTGHE
jgi:hypothetical protein